MQVEATAVWGMNAVEAVTDALGDGVAPETTSAAQLKDTKAGDKADETGKAAVTLRLSASNKYNTLLPGTFLRSICIVKQ